ncbi:MAG TPA: hypothetical protein VK805_21170 [Candidatus Baltobacteraceae bacterium]|nr:hypothetical protein [Candidatus Baltobacteraceae bacterium]
MKRGFLAVLLGAMVLFAVGCKPRSDEKEAIRAGVIKHLAALNMLDMSKMDVNVTQATINGNQAQAQVEIRAKGADSAGNAMQIGYAMEKHGAEWVVLKSTGMSGGMQHPGPGEAPPAGTTPGAMPPGHPNVRGGSGQTPGTHPDFNAILNSAPSQQSNPPVPPPTSTGKP